MKTNTSQLVGVGVIALLVGSAVFAQENTLRLLNSLRMSECSGRSASMAPLRVNKKLDAAAQLVSGGYKTPDALRRAGYQADQSSMVHLGGKLDDSSLKRLLAGKYCASLVDPGLVEVGIARSQNDFAIVLAAPFAPPATGDASKIAQEVLQFTNTARAKARKCGRRAFPAAPPLVLNAVLAKAADRHSKDMAQHGRLSHEGSDGSTPDERVTRAGFKWKHTGENVASGQLSAKEVVDGWVSSPHHCENIMEPNFTQMAVAYAVDKQSMGIYWTQVFARPR